MATNNPIDVATGATGTVLAGQGVGTAPSFTATPTVTSITINNAPVATTDGTNKTYVDSAIAAVNPATSVLEASIAALTVTYFNGVAGIGATLTNAGAQTAFTLDGQSTSVGDRVLIKDQASTFQNGVYTVTVVGTGATNWVLTRAVDYDQSSDINSTGVINVLNGTVNALTGWLINSKVTNVGTDPITYTKYSNAPITTTQYAVLVGAASNGVGSVGPSATTGQVLQSQGNAANPAFSTATFPSTATSTGTILRADGTNWVATTATYPATTTINQILFSSAGNVVGGITAANSAVLVSTSAGVPQMSSTMTNGQLIIGSTSATPTATTLTGGSGISITNGAGSITINSVGSGLTWTDQSGTFTATTNNGYFITSASTPTLAASPNEGDTISFILDAAATVTITGNTGQKIRLAGSLSASAGTCASSTRGNAITLVYRTTGTTWIALSSEGTWTIT